VKMRALVFMLCAMAAVHVSAASGDQITDAEKTRCDTSLTRIISDAKTSNFEILSADKIRELNAVNRGRSYPKSESVEVAAYYELYKALLDLCLTLNEKSTGRCFRFEASFPSGTSNGVCSLSEFGVNAVLGPD